MQSLLQKLFPTIFAYDQDSYISRLRSRRMDILKPYFSAVQEQVDGVVRILDVGGSYFFWTQSGMLDPERFHITLLNLDETDLPDDVDGFSAIAGDACRLDEVEGDFDLIFSNSVIEHVGGDDQMKLMAEGIRNSGLSYMIQTPSFWFPFDPHSQIPFFQFIPHWIRAWIIMVAGNINWFSRGSNYRESREVSKSIDMLSMRRFRLLFPDAEILTERLAGMPKSYVAVKVVSSSVVNLAQRRRGSAVYRK